MSTLDKILEPVVTLTPSTSAYSAGDAVGNSAASAIMEFDVSGSATGSGLINSLKVLDDDNEGAAGTLHLFRSSPSAITDNAAWSPTFADLKEKVLSITLGTFNTYNSLKMQTIEDINKTFKVTGGKLYGVFVVSGTPTYASSKSLVFELGILTQ